MLFSPFHRVALAVALLCATGLSARAATEAAADADTRQAQAGAVPKAPEKGKRLRKVHINASPYAPLKKTSTAGSRLGQSLLDTPASADSLDVDRLAREGVRNTADLVQRAAGFSFQGSPGSGSTFQSRGFSGNDSIAQLEDGVRVPTTSGTQSLPQDGFGYERVEVLRGAASVLHGDGAIGGAINLVRKQPQAHASQDLELGLGRFDSWRLGLGLNQPLLQGLRADKPLLALRLDLLDKGGDGAVQRGDWRQRKLMSTLRWQPLAQWQVDLLTDTHRDRNSAYFGTPLRQGRIASDLRDRNYNVQDGLWHVRQDRHRLQSRYELSPEWKLQAELYHFDINRRWRNLEEYALSADGRAVERMGYLAIEHQLRQRGGSVQAQGQLQVLGRELKLLLGAQQLRLNFTHVNDGYNYTVTTVVDPWQPEAGSYLGGRPMLPRMGSQLRQSAAFAEASLALLPRWTASAALRHERAAVQRQVMVPKADAWSARFTPNTWRLALSHQLQAGHQLYVQTGVATDPVSNIATISKGAANWQLSSGRQWELGSKHAFARGELTAALYHIDKDGLLTTEKLPGQEPRTVQGGRLQSYGLELGGAWRLGQGWSVDGNLSLNRTRYQQLVLSGKDLSGHQAPHAARTLANLGLKWAAHSQELGLRSRWVGQRYTSAANSFSLPGYAVFDAHWTQRLSPALSVGAQLRNLADTVYATSSYSATQVMLGEPRQLMLTLHYTH
ncbi:TonB-dependent receptor [Roseateles sp. BYS180W]|uniref:TonB-dependent receptor n=1 Tax=Roseateles rivi TaxID=3299028 RepID=A0ABW7FSL7_9BURK